jgi:hypothetical protein
MSNPTDRETLLADVLAESSPADFREAMLRDTLRLARRRRRFRQTRSALVLLALLGLLATFMRPSRPPQPIASHPPAKPAAPLVYQLISTRPLPASAIVTTRHFPDLQLAGSVPAVVQIATTSRGYTQINDSQLLSLLAQRPALLVRTGPHSEELVFADPSDRNGFPAN